MSSNGSSNIQAALQALEVEAAQIVTQISSLEAEKIALTRRLQELQAAIEPLRKLVSPQSSAASSVANESGVIFGGLTISPAIHKCLKIRPGQTAAQIATSLYNGGYETGSSNLPNLVGATLRRLEAQGKVTRDQENRWFVPSSAP